jgi:histidine triad (HIT) family protein
MNYLAFHDTNPKAPVHVLIIPKKHIPTLNDFEDKEIISELLPTIKKVAEELKIENAYKLVIHVGEDAGQVIFHLHVHMMGGWHHRQTD